MASQKLLRLKYVLEAVGIKRSTLYDWLNVNSKRYDPHFPRPVKIVTSAVAWVEAEIENWIALKLSERDGKK